MLFENKYQAIQRKPRHAIQSRWQVEKFEPTARHHALRPQVLRHRQCLSICFLAPPSTEHRQAGWLELKLIQYAYSLGLAVNDNCNSPKNMATLPGSPCSWVNPGCVYLVPVSATQTHYFVALRCARRNGGPETEAQERTERRPNHFLSFFPWPMRRCI
jgi:hypothetical protein